MIKTKKTILTIFTVLIIGVIFAYQSYSPGFLDLGPRTLHTITTNDAHAAPSVPAFPGAEGWGAESVGGRGGRVIEVTTLADDIPAPVGSLRACIEASGPRICVFRVSGVIGRSQASYDLEKPLEIRNPYITIAGQTAPGGGILISGITNATNAINIYTHDVIIRYLRFRPLRFGAVVPHGGVGNVNIFNGGYNVIIDHCSTSWTAKSGLSVWSAPSGEDTYNITFQRCLLSEVMASHSTNMMVGGTVDDLTEGYLKTHEISIHHNLFAHTSHRNPRISTSGAEVINNVVYNWFDRVGESVAKNTLDLINNYWKKGPMSESKIFLHETFTPISGQTFEDASIYISGNIVEGPAAGFPDPLADNWVLIRMF